jgi:phosphoglycerol geranylgeranyltransferase
MSLYDSIVISSRNNKKLLSVLVDPDKTTPEHCFELSGRAKDAGVDYFFVGSSILTNGHLDNCIRVLKKSSTIPVVLFPGNIMQISSEADAILFLSLISGRNPDLLIGRHVLAAPLLKNTSLEIIPTGYMLVDSGRPTSVSYMSYTLPIPHDKDDIAMCTAMAGEMLGLKLTYIDAGSGAKSHVSPSMISALKQSTSIPLIAGGGIRSAETAIELCNAGADMLVIGNAFEKNPELLNEISEAIHSLQAS